MKDEFTSCEPLFILPLPFVASFVDLNPLSCMGFDKALNKARDKDIYLLAPHSSFISHPSPCTLV